MKANALGIEITTDILPSLKYKKCLCLLTLCKCTDPNLCLSTFNRTISELRY